MVVDLAGSCLIRYDSPLRDASGSTATAALGQDTMTIAWPGLFAFACILLVATLFIAWRRRILVPIGAVTPLILGAFLLTLAGGGVSIHLPQSRQVVVMIDDSPSTRGAGYHDGGVLTKRIGELVGSARFRVEHFDQEDSVEQTHFAPPADADAILLFSDAQFDPPSTSVPIYFAIDAGLDQPQDAAVTSLEFRGANLAIASRNSSGPRDLKLTGTTSGPTTLPAGQSMQLATLDPATENIGARISPGDRWPENDALWIHRHLTSEHPIWSIGNASGLDNVKSIAPADFPVDASELLAPAAIVLNNLPASALTDLQKQRLTQYVRDLGGALVIIGGDRAFAAGGYSETALDALSPLASQPTEPQRNWIVLVDASGSMAAPAGTQTRFEQAANAVRQIVRSIPPGDPLNVGSFARDIRWWSQNRTAGEVAKSTIPPFTIAPQGPTNLQAVLAGIAQQHQDGSNSELIVITDGDAQIDDPESLAGALRESHVRLNLLLTAKPTDNAILRIAALTAGSATTQIDPQLWAAQGEALAKSRLPNRLERGSAAAQFKNDLASLSTRNLDQWNRTWIKADATELASIEQPGTRLAVGASWRVGLGRVSAFAFTPSRDELTSLMEKIRQPPQDPRFRVNIVSGQQLNISVDAIDGQQYLNDQKLAASLFDAGNTNGRAIEKPIPQIAPGRYAIDISSPRVASLGVVRLDQQVIERFSVAGRYAPEFEKIGNNYPAMNEMAQRFGGVIISPRQVTPIDFHWPPRSVSLVSLCSIGGAALIGLGLLLCRGKN